MVTTVSGVKVEELVSSSELVDDSEAVVLVTACMLSLDEARKDETRVGINVSEHSQSLVVRADSVEEDDVAGDVSVEEGESVDDDSLSDDEELDDEGGAVVLVVETVAGDCYTKSAAKARSLKASVVGARQGHKQGNQAKCKNLLDSVELSVELGVVLEGVVVDETLGVVELGEGVVVVKEGNDVVVVVEDCEVVVDVVVELVSGADMSGDSCRQTSTSIHIEATPDQESATDRATATTRSAARKREGT